MIRFFWECFGNDIRINLGLRWDDFGQISEGFWIQLEWNIPRIVEKTKVTECHKRRV